MIKQIVFTNCIVCSVPLSETVEECMFCGQIGKVKIVGAIDDGSEK